MLTNKFKLELENKRNELRQKQRELKREFEDVCSVLREEEKKAQTYLTQDNKEVIAFEFISTYPDNLPIWFITEEQEWEIDLWSTSINRDKTNLWNGKIETEVKPGDYIVKQGYKDCIVVDNETFKKNYRRKRG